MDEQVKADMPEEKPAAPAPVKKPAKKEPSKAEVKELDKMMRLALSLSDRALMGQLRSAKGKYKEVLEAEKKRRMDK